MPGFSSSQVQSPNVLKNNDGAGKVGHLSTLPGAVKRVISEILDERVSVKSFGAVGDGITNDSAAYQAALVLAKKVYIPEGTYLVSGVTSSAQVNIKGAGVTSTIIKNFTDGATILSFDQSGVSDKERRNWTMLSDFTIRDSSAGTGTGIKFTEVLNWECNNLYIRDFTAGLGIYSLETLWSNLININTDKSEVRLVSLLDPHFNNAIYLRGGEYRNPGNGKSCLHIENADVVVLANVTAEGDTGGTSYVGGMYFKNVQQLNLDGVYTEVLPASTSGAMTLDGCESVTINSALINSQIETTPSLNIIGGTKSVSIKDSRISTGPLVASSTTGNIAIKKSHLDCKIDIADGVHFTMEGVGPTTSVCIPTIPYMQKSDPTSRAAFKNWFVDSSFENAALVTTIQAGAPVTTKDVTVGYTDNFSTKIVGVANDKIRTETLGTTDSTADRVCISFMAKVTTKQDFNYVIFANGARGSGEITVTEDWRRYFVFGVDADCGILGAGIFMDLEFTGTNDLWIDDVQTVGFTTYADACELIDKFRYVPTNGTRKTTKSIDPIIPGLIEFGVGVQFTKRIVAPTIPKEGAVYFADGTSWNPGAGKGLYFYDGTVYAKL